MRGVFTNACGHLHHLQRRDLLKRLFKLTAKRIMSFKG